MSTCNHTLKPGQINELVPAAIPDTLVGFTASFDVNQKTRDNYRKGEEHFLRRKE
jgi:hypothetical protein